MSTRRTCPGPLLAVLILAAISFGCKSEEDPFTTAGSEGAEAEPQSFTIVMAAQPSSSTRTRETNFFWHTGASVVVVGDLELIGEVDHEDDGHHGAEHEEDGVGHEEEPGHGEEPGHEEEPGHDATHDAGGLYTIVDRLQVVGYDVLVSVMEPQHRLIWNSETNAREEHEPAPGDDRYVMVHLGSSAATAKHPHAEGIWSQQPPYKDDLNDEEKEIAEEDFSGMRQIFTASLVRIKVERVNEDGSRQLQIAERELRAVETDLGLRYADNLLIPDGTYDVTVTVERPKIARLADEGDGWAEDFVFEFTDVLVSGGDGSLGTTSLGYKHRHLDAGEGGHFTVLDDWGDELDGHLHPHRLYLDNHRGNVSQLLPGGENTLVCHVEALGVRPLYDQGILISPAEDVFEDGIYLEISLFDPAGLLDHHSEEFFDLPNAGVWARITNDLSGKSVLVQPEDFVPTYSERYGLHYGVNLELPAGPTPAPATAPGPDSGGGHGGHDHG